MKANIASTTDLSANVTTQLFSRNDAKDLVCHLSIRYIQTCFGNRGITRWLSSRKLAQLMEQERQRVDEELHHLE